jgi:hypothetical protein
MHWIDLVGFAAAFTVLASFCMTTIVSLRSVAIVSNVLFIFYGMLGHIYPVFFLHITLLPVNLTKLYQIQHRPRQVTNREVGGLAELMGKLNDARMLLRKVKRWRRQARHRSPGRRTLTTKEVAGNGNAWNVATQARFANLR